MENKKKQEPIKYIMTINNEKHYFKYEWTIEVYNKFIKENKINHNEYMSNENMKKWGKIYNREYQRYLRAKKTQKNL